MAEWPVSRLRMVLEEINARRRNEGETEEYTAWFRARWEVVRNLVARVRCKAPWNHGAVVVDSGEEIRPGVIDGVFRWEAEYARYHRPLVARWMHPVYYTHRKAIPAVVKSRTGWLGQGRRVRDDAVWSSQFVVCRYDGLAYVRGGDLYHIADTYLTPKSLLRGTRPEDAQGFRRKLTRRPDHATGWLVLADWCQEHGHQEMEADIRQYWEWRVLGIVN